MYNREYTPERITELKPNEIFVEKLSDTFEEAITQSMPAIERQLAKFKEKQSQK